MPDIRCRLSVDSCRHRAGGLAPDGLVNRLRAGGRRSSAAIRRPTSGIRCFRPWKAWRRPTLPRLETQYHRRWGFSRPSSGWDRVLGPPQWPPDRRWTDVRDMPASSLQAFRRLAALPAPRGAPPLSSRERGGALPVLAAARDGSNGCDQACRAISTGQLHALLHFHTRPIDVVVFHGSRARPRFEVGFPLRCLQRLSRPYIATRRCGWRHNRYTRGTSIPVLSY